MYDLQELRSAGASALSEEVLENGWEEIDDMHCPAQAHKIRNLCDVVMIVKRYNWYIFC